MKVQELTSVGLGGQLVADDAFDPRGWDPEWLRVLLHKYGVLLLRGTALDEDALAAVTAQIDELDPPDDIEVSGTYRRRVAGVLARRALVDAAARAAEEAS